MKKDYSKKPRAFTRAFMLMTDVNYFGETIHRGTCFYNFNDRDIFTPCIITEGNVPVLDFTKAIDVRNVVANKEYFCEIPPIKEYLSKGITIQL